MQSNPLAYVQQVYSMCLCILLMHNAGTHTRTHTQMDAIAALNGKPFFVGETSTLGGLLQGNKQVDKDEVRTAL
jgi:hypothetical protein